MFLLKKIIAAFFYPFSVVLIILLVGICLLWFSRRTKAGKIVVTAGFALLVLFSYGMLADAVLESIENRYSPLLDTSQLNGIKWVVVLGGAHQSDPKFPPNQQLVNSSLTRLIEGIRLYRQLPESRIVLLGGAPFEKVAEATVMAQTATSLGVDPADLILETDSRDTKDQAEILYNMMGSDRFILVTSASHMARAMAMLNKKGLHPVPAPTDFWVKESQALRPGDLFPAPSALQKWGLAFHEYLGMVWGKIRGQI